MNNGALNTYTLNGSAIDPVVRAVVTAKAYAVVATKSRVFAYFRSTLALAAQMTGALGRVFVRANSVSATASSQISGRLYRVFARLAVTSQGRAFVSVTLFTVRGVVSVTASAVSTITAGVLTRNAVSTAARATVSAAAKVAGRLLTEVSAVALVSATGTIYQRRYLRSPMTAFLRALVEPIERVLRRSVVTAEASVSVSAAPRYVIREPVYLNPAATVVIDFNVVKRIPWDEPAPEDRTFKVNPEVFTFVVA